MPLVAGAVFLATLVCVVVRPFDRSEAWWTTGGALLVLGIGAVSPQQAWHALTEQANLFLFLLGLMGIAGLADAAGFFDVAGALAVALARGSGRRLLLAVFGVGALVTAFLSNDATALILTPVVYTVVTRLRLRPLPYLLAATFVADTASLLLPVSNPINVLVGARLGLPLVPYLEHFLPAAIAVILVNAAIFLAVFWRRAGRRFDVDWRALLRDAVPDRRYLMLTVGGLLAVVAGYLAATATGFPVGLVAAGGAVLLLLGGLARRRLPFRKAREHVSLAVLVYVAGLFVLVAALEQVGVTGAVAHGLRHLARPGPGAVVTGALAAAIGANGVNNVPAATFLLSTSAALHHAARAPFLAGTLLGADLGPNLTPVGSLSTMLWLVAVRRRGVRVSALDYLKLGAITTPALLLAGGALVTASYR
ncbi:MAG: ArsB/NhaD family transporter [Candidatus Dormibacteraceae bacterium]